MVVDFQNMKSESTQYEPIIKVRADEAHTHLIVSVQGQVSKNILIDGVCAIGRDVTKDELDMFGCQLSLEMFEEAFKEVCKDEN